MTTLNLTPSDIDEITATLQVADVTEFYDVRAMPHIGSAFDSAPIYLWQYAVDDQIPCLHLLDDTRLAESALFQAGVDIESLTRENRDFRFSPSTADGWDGQTLTLADAELALQDALLRELNGVWLRHIQAVITDLTGLNSSTAALAWPKRLDAQAA